MGAAAPAASFDCAKAQSRIEKAICADAEVSDLDEYLGRYSAAARSALGRSADCLRTDQAQWLRTRNACADAACLKKACLERLAELHPLQPGASALRNVELPRGPALVWIVAPASDQVAAPPRPDAKPFVARGKIVNEIVQGDGFVLRTAEGTPHILMLSSLLESPGDTQLEHTSSRADASSSMRGGRITVGEPLRDYRGVLTGVPERKSKL